MVGDGRLYVPSEEIIKEPTKNNYDCYPKYLNIEGKSNTWKVLRDHMKHGQFRRVWRDVKLLVGITTENLKVRATRRMFQKLLDWGVLVQCYNVIHKTSYKQVDIDLDDIRKSVMECRDILGYITRAEDIVIVVGRPQYASMMKDATSIQLSLQYGYRGEKRYYDTTVLLVPWFDGVLPIPRKRVEEALGGGKHGVHQSYSSRDVVSRFIPQGDFPNPSDETWLPRP